MPNNFSIYGSSYSSLIFYILFLSKGNVLKITAEFCDSFFLLLNILVRVLVCLWSLLSISSGDIEINTGALSNCKEYVLICHGNLSSISLLGYSKLFLLNAYVILHKFDIICLSETYIGSTNPIDVDKLQIPGYSLILSDHLCNTKRGGFCIYYRSSLLWGVRNIG